MHTRVKKSGFSPVVDHNVVFLGSPFHCHSASFHPGVGGMIVDDYQHTVLEVYQIVVTWTEIQSRGE